ncbi:MAG TPA: response regulator transcription factor [Chloroflexota bacterium]|nr:response regulator transcription factor [Chloroflexota bacterium]
MEAITVLIVDDHPVVRDGLRYMLHATDNIRVVAEASTGLEALDRVGEFRPQVVLMDIRMPDMDGLEATKLIKERHPGSSVVIMTMYDDEEYVAEAVRVGAAGYLLKDAPKVEICRTVEAAAGGDVTLRAPLLQRALRNLHLSAGSQTKSTKKPERMPRNHLLTPRELAVLRLLVEGKTNKEIGEQLVISEETSKKHVQRIVSKLGASDRTGAAVAAVRLGLVD